MNLNGLPTTSKDFFNGAEYIEAVLDGMIAMDDITLMLLMDGAQLYQNKTSECWIYIWIILDHPPGIHYKKKHVIPGSFILGPKNPKNIDSFLFPGLYHLTSIQKEGLLIWNARHDHVLFLIHSLLYHSRWASNGMFKCSAVN
jgi:hypothetical protein